MGNKSVKYWNDLSQQEKDLAIALGKEGEYSHEKPVRENTVWKVNLPSYEKREDVPEQARELWDMFHR